MAAISTAANPIEHATKRVRLLLSTPPPSSSLFEWTSDVDSASQLVDAGFLQDCWAADSPDGHEFYDETTPVASSSGLSRTSTEHLGLSQPRYANKNEFTVLMVSAHIFMNPGSTLDSKILVANLAKTLGWTHEQIQLWYQWYQSGVDTRTLGEQEQPPVLADATPEQMAILWDAMRCFPCPSLEVCKGIAESFGWPPEDVKRWMTAMSVQDIDMQLRQFNYELDKIEAAEVLEARSTNINKTLRARRLRRLQQQKETGGMYVRRHQESVSFGLQ